MLEQFGEFLARLRRHLANLRWNAMLENLHVIDEVYRGMAGSTRLAEMKTSLGLDVNLPQAEANLGLRARGRRVVSQSAPSSLFLGWRSTGQSRSGEPRACD